MHKDVESMLFPIPKQLRRTGKDFIIHNGSSMRTSTCKDSRFLHSCNLIVELLTKDRLLDLDIQPGFSMGEFTICIGKTIPKISMEIQTGGYHLDINSEELILQAIDIEGFIAGANTLKQLLRHIDNTSRLPGLHIEDYPDYQWRGFMIDAARAPCPVEYMKHIIEICADVKLNFLIFREGDDELAAVQYNHLPIGHENPFSLTFEQIKELIHHAHLHGILFIPEIESLGHCAAKRIHYPHLLKGGEKLYYGSLGYHMRKMHLDPANIQSLELLGKMYSEWMEVAAAPFIHLGCDEVKLPMATQDNYIRKVLAVFNQCISKSGKQFSPMVWSDAPLIHDHANVVRCLWCYEEHHNEFSVPSLQNEFLHRQKIHELYESDQHTVFMAGGSGSGHTPYARGPFKGVIENLIHWSRLGHKKENWKGLFAVQWSGNMLNQWLGDFFGVAALGWNAANSSTSIETLIKDIKFQVSKLTERDPHIIPDFPEMWDGITLNNGQFDKDYVITPECQHIAPELDN